MWRLVTLYQKCQTEWVVNISATLQHHGNVLKRTAAHYTVCVCSVYELEWVTYSSDVVLCEGGLCKSLLRMCSYL